MKCENIAKKTVVLLLISMMFNGAVQAAEAEFTSAEIKEIRFLSRALIKSRANEKVRMDKELQPERERIQNMQDALQTLESSHFNNLSVTSTSASSSENVISLDGVPAAQLSDHNSTSNNNVTPFGSATNSAGEVNLTNRRMAITQTIQKIQHERKKPEVSHPDRVESRKDRDNQKKNKELVTSVAMNVEKELQDMQSESRIDSEKLKTLKHRLTITKQDMAHDDIEPTFQTRTKHR